MHVPIDLTTKSSWTQVADTMCLAIRVGEGLRTGGEKKIMKGQVEKISSCSLGRRKLLKETKDTSPIPRL